MSAIDEGEDLDRSGTAAVDQGVECGAQRAAGEEHVVDHDHDRAVDAPRRAAVDIVERGLGDRRTRPVVAMRARIERGDRRRVAAQGLELARDSAGERDATRRDAHQDHRIEHGMALDDLVREAHRDALQGRRIEQLRVPVERLGKATHRAALTPAASRAGPS